MARLADAAARAPRAPGVYFFLGEVGTLLYVGKADRSCAARVGLPRPRTATGRRSAAGPSCAMRTARGAVGRSARRSSGAGDARLRSHRDASARLQPCPTPSKAASATCVVARRRSDHARSRSRRQQPGRRAYGTLPHLAPGSYSSAAKVTKSGYVASCGCCGLRKREPRASRTPRRIAGRHHRAHARPASIRCSTPHSAASFSGHSDRLLAALNAAIATRDMYDFTRFALDATSMPRVASSSSGLASVQPATDARHSLAPGPVSGEHAAELLAAEVRARLQRWPRATIGYLLDVSGRAARADRVRGVDSSRNFSTASLNAFGVSAIRPCAAPRST